MPAEGECAGVKCFMILLPFCGAQLFSFFFLDVDGLRAAILRERTRIGQLGANFSVSAGAFLFSLMVPFSFL